MHVVRGFLGYLGLGLLIAGGAWLGQHFQAIPGQAPQWWGANTLYAMAGMAGVGAALLIWASFGRGTLRAIIGVLTLQVALVGALIALRSVHVPPGPVEIPENRTMLYAAAAAVGIGLLITALTMWKPGARRTIVGLFGLLLALSGGIWTAQGLGYLPGSYMSGDMMWAYIGGGTVLIGLIMLAIGWRKRPMPSAA